MNTSFTLKKLILLNTMLFVLNLSFGKNAGIGTRSPHGKFQLSNLVLPTKFTCRTIIKKSLFANFIKFSLK